MRQLTPEDAKLVDFDLTQKANRLIAVKRATYASNDDPYENYRNAAEIAGIEAWQVVIARMEEKLTRIRNMTSAGMTKDKWDDLMGNDFPDIMNFDRILAGLCLELTLEE